MKNYKQIITKNSRKFGVTIRLGWRLRLSNTKVFVWEESCLYPHRLVSPTYLAHCRPLFALVNFLLFYLFIYLCLLLKFGPTNCVCVCLCVFNQKEKKIMATPKMEFAPKLVLFIVVFP